MTSCRSYLRFNDKLLIHSQLSRRFHALSALLYLSPCTLTPRLDDVICGTVIAAPVAAGVERQVAAAPRITPPVIDRINIWEFDPYSNIRITGTKQRMETEAIR